MFDTLSLNMHARKLRKLPSFKQQLAKVTERNFLNQSLIISTLNIEFLIVAEKSPKSLSPFLVWRLFSSILQQQKNAKKLKEKTMIFKQTKSN